MGQQLAPSKIRFTQDTISNKFRRNKGSVHEAIDKIRQKKMSVNDFPTIEVIKKDNKYYSLDNRRLYIFRVLEKEGLLRDVPITITGRSMPDKKFTTTNDGVTVKMRYEQTRKHSFESLLLSERYQYKILYFFHKIAKLYYCT